MARSIELMLRAETFTIYATDLGEEGIDLPRRTAAMGRLLAASSLAQTPTVGDQIVGAKSLRYCVVA